MTTTLQIQSKLAMLGKSPSQIAKTLEERGIKGIKECYQNCPIAEYLKEEIFEATQILVMEEETEIFIPKRRNHKSRFKIRNNQAIVRFIQKFDAGDYPSLEYKEDWSNSL